LRILRGAGGEGLACNEISERLLVKSPDITRLLDRLEKQELIMRNRSKEDRRIVNANISGAGLELLERLDEPMQSLHKTQLGSLNQEKLTQLLALINELSEE
jgi:DNA-binding MarR family transcriptional regulator